MAGSMAGYAGHIAVCKIDVEGNELSVSAFPEIE